MKAEHGKQRLATSVAATIGNYLTTAYIQERDVELSQKYVDCILELATRPRPGDLNNIGYVALARGDYESAEKFLLQSLQTNEKFPPKLTFYNLGVCYILKGMIRDARDYLRRAEAEIEEDDGAGCIISIEEQSGALVSKELFKVDALQPYIKECLDICGRVESDGLPR